eukprot:gnl/Hemi2/21703_TR7231_c0_g1_i1.p1 gnl/Hemi2/21703_TR7231_c0_g1~~gnl/Hemi2/21703_TR7231_c0_g1_i1.p1  ORF type:complete len:554 (+),score=218.42 gnl/Hemi2/21703_TR7231_c0_g1_i1:48-1709(+)
MAGLPSILSALALAGSRSQGQDVRSQNVAAAQAVANILRTSLGPVGLDKMLVDEIGDVLITNDGATMLKQIEVEHPAAKLLVDLSNLQDEEVGDGTTSVVVIAAELLKRGNDLVKNKIHPTTVISGFRLAAKEAVKYVQENLSVRVDTLGKECLMNIARTSISSKIISGELDFFAKIAVDAVSNVKSVSRNGDVKYPIKAINILKAHGRSVRESALLNGYALNCTRACQGMVQRVTGAKIALLDINLQKYKAPMGVTIRVNDPKQIEQIRQRELDITRDRIQLILRAGANVIMTTKGIDDQHLKYCIEAGAIGVRRCKKSDLLHIAKATGGTVITSLANLEGDESFDPAWLGQAEEVSEDRIADDEMIIVKGCKHTRANTILLRGPSEFMLDEVERSLHDALCIVKRTLESQQVVPGGGACEAALSVFLEIFATSLGSREQLAVAEFAQALLVIPKQLAVNAALDATDLVARLRAHHNTSQKPGEKNAQDLANYGLDLTNGVCRNNLTAGVLEPAMSKVKSLQFATEAAITILRIDDLIKMNPKRQDGPDDDE